MSLGVLHASSRTLWMLATSPRLFVLTFGGAFTFACGSLYLSGIAKIFFLVTSALLWDLWFLQSTRNLLCNKPAALLKSIRHAARSFIFSWWLIVWMIFLRWGIFTFKQMPFVISEQADLLFLSIFGLLFLMQIVYNFTLLIVLNEHEKGLVATLKRAANLFSSYPVTILMCFVSALCFCFLAIWVIGLVYLPFAFIAHRFVSLRLFINALYNATVFFYTRAFLRSLQMMLYLSWRK